MGVKLVMVLAWAMLMLVLVFVSMPMLMVVVIRVLMSVPVPVFVLMGMSADARRVFAWQSASAVFTHYSISSEATSISRPARRLPLGSWQSGHSANISSD